MATDLQWTRKYRPTKLSDYVGNEHTKEKIRALTARGRLPQTILLQGEKGTGKTTMARLMAKSLMCETPVSGESCGECSSCVQLDDNYIKQGIAPRNMSVHEFDITKMNKREDATAIVDRMGKRSFGSEKRVFILDEMQRATPEAQSSFLKITEEPVPGLYVILCTTDPEDLLVPLRSRFNKFDIRRPVNADIVKRLEDICIAEGVNYSIEGLRLLADKNNNVPRDCIIQAETIGMMGKIDRKAVEVELHIISQGIFMDFLDGCMKGNLAGVVKMLESIQREDTFTVIEFVGGMGNFLADLLNAKVGVNLDRYSATDIKHMRKYVKRFTDENMVDMLRLLKDYSTITKSMEFQLLSLAVGVMDILRVEEKVKEVPPEVVGTRFSDITKKVKESKPVVGLVPASDSDVQAIFGSVRMVKIDEGGD